MSWYKNINTGLVWELEGDLEKQVSTNSDYEKIDVEVKNKNNRTANPKEEEKEKPAKK